MFIFSNTTKYQTLENINRMNENISKIINSETKENYASVNLQLDGSNSENVISSLKLSFYKINYVMAIK